MIDVVEDSHDAVYHDRVIHRTFISDVSGEIFSLDSFTEQYTGRVFNVVAFPSGWFVVIETLFKFWVSVHELVSRSRELISLDLS